MRVNVRIAASLAVAAAVIVGVMAAGSSSTVPDVPLATVKRGEFVDALLLRGDIRARRAVTVNAPSGAGELRIMRLARTGTMIRKGDTIVDFDRATVQQTLRERSSELKRATAEIDRIQAQRRLAEQGVNAEVERARFEVARAKLEVREEDFLSRSEVERRRLALADAESTLRGAEEKLKSERAAAAAEVRSARHKSEKTRFEAQQAERQLNALTLVATADGLVVVLPNFRAGGPMNTPPDFREGDRTFPGAQIAEIPDLSSILIAAKVDEGDRTRLAIGLKGTVAIEALPGQEFTAEITEISALTRTDFSSWPPTRNFEVVLRMDRSDKRLRPGMTATARVVLDRVAGATLVPVQAIFSDARGAIVYVRRGSGFEAQPVKVERRGSSDAMVTGVEPGTEVAMARPVGVAP